MADSNASFRLREPLISPQYRSYKSCIPLTQTCSPLILCGLLHVSTTYLFTLRSRKSYSLVPMASDATFREETVLIYLNTGTLLNANHQIRNLENYIAYKSYNIFMSNLKSAYEAAFEKYVKFAPHVQKTQMSNLFQKTDKINYVAKLRL